MFKTIFLIKNQVHFNVSFKDRLLFEKHKLDNFHNSKKLQQNLWFCQGIITIIIFSYYSQKLDTNDIKLYLTEDSKNFKNYKDSDLEIMNTFFSD